MKPLNVAIAVAALALPLSAADQQQQKPVSNTTTTTLSAPMSQEQTDSPLVRAAKATGRLGKKPAFVITNETLLKAGAHFAIASQTTPQPPLTMAPQGANAQKQQTQYAQPAMAPQGANAQKQQTQYAQPAKPPQK
jgi:hypothetical protein